MDHSRHELEAAFKTARRAIEVFRKQERDKPADSEKQGLKTSVSANRSPTQPSAESSGTAAATDQERVEQLTRHLTDLQDRHRQAVQAHGNVNEDKDRDALLAFIAHQELSKTLETLRCGEEGQRKRDRHDHATLAQKLRPVADTFVLCPGLMEDVAKTLAEPVLVRLSFHFDGRRKTGQADRPEWRVRFVRETMEQSHLPVIAKISRAIEAAGSASDTTQSLLDAFVAHVLDVLLLSMATRTQTALPSVMHPCLTEMQAFDAVLQDFGVTCESCLERFAACEAFQSWLCFMADRTASFLNTAFDSYDTYEPLHDPDVPEARCSVHVAVVMQFMEEMSALAWTLPGTSAAELTHQVVFPVLERVTQLLHLVVKSLPAENDQRMGVLAMLANDLALLQPLAEPSSLLRHRPLQLLFHEELVSLQGTLHSLLNSSVQSLSLVLFAPTISLDAFGADEEQEPTKSARDAARQLSLHIVSPLRAILGPHGTKMVVPLVADAVCNPLINMVESRETATLTGSIQFRVDVLALLSTLYPLASRKDVLSMPSAELLLGVCHVICLSSEAVAELLRITSGAGRMDTVNKELGRHGVTLKDHKLIVSLLEKRALGEEAVKQVN